MPSKETQWGWMSPGSEVADGPYDTREEAIEDARKYYADDELPARIIVGQIVWPEPSEFGRLVADCDALCERMDETLFDGGDFHSGEDPGFMPKSLGEAQVALEAALEQWAREHIQWDGPWTLREDDDSIVTLEADNA